MENTRKSNDTGAQGAAFSPPRLDTPLSLDHFKPAIPETSSTAVQPLQPVHTHVNPPKESSESTDRSDTPCAPQLKRKLSSYMNSEQDATLDLTPMSVTWPEDDRGDLNYEYEDDSHEERRHGIAEDRYTKYDDIEEVAAYAFSRASAPSPESDRGDEDKYDDDDQQEKRAEMSRRADIQEDDSTEGEACEEAKEVQDLEDYGGGCIALADKVSQRQTEAFFRRLWKDRTCRPSPLRNVVCLSDEGSWSSRCQGSM